MCGLNAYSAARFGKDKHNVLSTTSDTQDKVYKMRNPYRVYYFKPYLCYL